MTIQTIEFELSKELDRKIPIISDFKKSYFFWVISPEFKNEARLLSEMNVKGLMELECELTLYPAYTLDEILEMLPKYIKLYNLDLQRKARRYEISFFELKGPDLIVLRSVRNKNPAEAAGQLLKWCIENEYVKSEEASHET